MEIKNHPDGRLKHFMCLIYASGAIAPTGHIEAHVPHEIHFAGSMTHLPSGPVDIAQTGHIPMHVWHPIHLEGSIL